MRTKPDPKLKEAMEEIKVILKQHDIAAVVILSSPDAMEYLMEIEPSWSCARIEDHPSGGLAIRINTKTLPTPEAKKAALEATIGTIIGFQDVMLTVQDQMGVVLKMVGEHIGSIDHQSRRFPDE